MHVPFRGYKGCVNTRFTGARNEENRFLKGRSHIGLVVPDEERDTLQAARKLYRMAMSLETQIRTPEARWAITIAPLGVGSRLAQIRAAFQEHMCQGYNCPFLRSERDVTRASKGKSDP